MKLGKMKYRGTIVVGIDGVLADFEKEFCEAFGYNSRHLYSLESRYPEHKDLIREFVANPVFYEDLAPIFGGLLFVRQAHARGWYILLVTSRDKSLRDVTKRWLEKYGVVYNEIIFAKNKREAIAGYDNINSSRKVKIVVDDSVEVLDNLSDKYCVAWEQEWNNWAYPRMWYDQSKMKLMMTDHPSNHPVGVWDKVGK